MVLQKCYNYYGFTMNPYHSSNHIHIYIQQHINYKLNNDNTSDR